VINIWLKRKQLKGFDIMKSANAVVQALIKEKVEVLFGIPGFPILPLYDVLYATGEIRHILIRHEHAASFMAYAYGMVTGNPGTCLVIDGPGATNIATGLADALTGSIPLVAIVGKIPGSFMGRGAVHELDSAFFKPITKEIFRISGPGDIFATIHKAYATASTGRKGPVCLEIPMEILNLDVPPETVDVTTGEGEGVFKTTVSNIEAAAKLINKAKKPLILAGGGALSAGASRELTALAEFLGIPVAVSHMGRGIIPDDHPLALGLLRNNPTLVNFIQQSDAVMAVGLRFSQILTFNWTLKIPRELIQIDIDPKQIGKNYPVEVAINGDARTELKNLLDYLKNEVKKREQEEYPRFKEVTEWKSLLTIGSVSNGVPIKPLRLIKGIRECLERDAVIAADVGNSFFWMLFFMEIYCPRTLLCSSSFSAMGCGLPFAIGAKLARPDKQVVCVTGDGGFLMNCQELATAVESNLALPVVIMNDCGYGAIRHMQDRAYQGRHIASNWESPDFVQIARGFGAEGMLITNPEEIEPALRSALKSDKPMVLDVRVDGMDTLPQNRLPGVT
jgi:acetolactate synthase-1/2/3 large subunit